MKIADINCKNVAALTALKMVRCGIKLAGCVRIAGITLCIGDARVHDDLVAKKALAVIMYSVSKSSYGMLGRLFGVSRSLVYRWIREAADQLPEPTVPGSIQEMEFDEMWHFIGSKKTKYGSSKRWVVTQGES